MSGRTWKPVARLAAFVLVVALYLSTLLASSPCLHEACHGDDASSPDHVCAITVLSQGGMTVANPAIFLPMPAPSTLGAPCRIAAPPAINDVRLSPGRAPPTLAF